MPHHDLVPVLETERLVLRGHQTSDFPESAAMWADPRVVAHISGTPFTAEQSWSRLLRYAGHWHHLGFGYWVVESRKDRAFLGEVGFADYHRDTSPSLKGKPEAGWAFKTDAQGNGYATEAVTAMLRWADRHLEFAQTACMFDPDYAASLNVARKTGYSNEVIGRYGRDKALFMERSRQPR
ncbi:GNAT family N-acetyltransferase [uncultured Roseovarius sp.]|uniref:GNAT family N-acetyltransferase n=1 Tax=uncultured Roseovarius sp. TaxID=293344 RepID=UPI002635A192|nr:GNAT family N-acetyltransferase [uncultured Roseovarius sp.]